MPEIVARFVDCHVFRRPPVAPEPANPVAEEWLVLKRAPHILLGGTWQMVSGSIEPGETAYHAAARELQEETGLRPRHFYQASYVNRFYIASADQIVLSPVFAAEVPATAPVRLSSEHTAHAWVPFAEARERYPWPGQKEAIVTIRDQFVLREPRKESTLDHLLPGLVG